MASLTWDQFQYNPEWFEDDQDEGDGSDDFDLTKYRRDEEEVYSELRRTEQGIGNLQLCGDDDANEDSEGGGKGGGSSTSVE